MNGDIVNTTCTPFTYNTNIFHLHFMVDHGANKTVQCSNILFIAVSGVENE